MDPVTSLGSDALFGWLLTIVIIVVPAVWLTGLIVIALKGKALAALGALLAIPLATVLALTDLFVGDAMPDPTAGDRFTSVISYLFALATWAMFLAAVVRLGEPESWWGKRAYQGEKLERAIKRFGPKGPPMPVHDPEADTDEFGAAPDDTAAPDDNAAPNDKAAPGDTAAPGTRGSDTRTGDPEAEDDPARGSDPETRGSDDGRRDDGRPHLPGGR